MENKEKYHKALIANNGRLNETELGERLGLTEDETYEIISQLLSEYKISHIENRACNYSLKKRADKKNNSH